MTEVQKPVQIEPRAHAAKAMPKLRVPNIRPQDIGLKIFHELPSVDDVEIDIIAVHGIGVDPKETWVHRNGVNWISNESMLPAVLPRARIMAFGYDSVWFGDSATRQTLEGVASNLLRELERKRENCPNRPMIFIGHCFGGLVIQEAYNLAVTLKNDYANMASSMVGMVFLGTPHHGVANTSGLTTQGKVFDAIVRSEVQIQDNILHTMAHNNDVLVKAVHNFTRGIQTHKPRPPKLYCFYEEKATRIGLIAGVDLPPEFVVNESSGTLSGHEKQSLSLDHFHMNKFESPEDNHFQNVSYQIKKMVVEAQNMMDIDVADKPNSTSVVRRGVINCAAPISREDKFAPRQNILDEIETKFTEVDQVALYGDMGSGKTHVAVEYAHKYHHKHSKAKVYWVFAHSPEQFELSLRSIAETLHVSKESRDSGKFLDEVCHKLKKKRRWLMVIDGLDDEARLKATGAVNAGESLLKFIPKPNGDNGRILITTRSKHTALEQVHRKPQHALKVGQVDEADASILLLGRVTSDPSRLKMVSAMARDVNGSAGALSMISAYRKSAGKEGIEKLKQMLASEPSPAAREVGIFKLLYGFIEAKFRESADFMLLVCALDVPCIPRCFFDRKEISHDLQLLEKHGAVEPSADDNVFCVTAMVRKCARLWLDKNENERHCAEAQAMHVMCTKFNNDDESAEDLLPCALAVLKFRPVTKSDAQKAATLALKVARYYLSLKQCPAALKCLEQQCLPLLRQAGDESPPKLMEEANAAIQEVKDMMAANKTLPSSRTAPRSLTEAQKQLQEAERSDSQWKDRDTIRKASGVASLSMWKQQQDDSDDPVILYQRILEWCKSRLGENHIDTARNHYNLALAHMAKGNLDEAEQLFHAALHTLDASKKKKSGELQTLALRIMASLASLHCSQGRLAEAEELFRMVIPSQMGLLGAEHPDTLQSRHDFALLLQEHGQLRATQYELREVLGAQVRVLEPNDPAMFCTARSMALNFRLQKSYDSADEVFRAVYSAQRARLGANHFETVRTRSMMDELSRERRGLGSV